MQYLLYVIVLCMSLTIYSAEEVVTTMYSVESAPRSDDPEDEYMKMADEGIVIHYDDEGKLITNNGSKQDDDPSLDDESFEGDDLGPVWWQEHKPQEATTSAQSTQNK